MTSYYVAITSCFSKEGHLGSAIFPHSKLFTDDMKMSGVLRDIKEDAKEPIKDLTHLETWSNEWQLQQH